MPYLGNVPAEAYTNTVKDSFNGDASTTAFTLSQPSTANNLRVVVENVIQDPTVAYTVSGTTLTFTSAPPVGTANIYAVHLGPATMTAVPPSEINNATNFTDGITVDKDGGTVITADRASSDGTIIDLQKSGTSVGKIGTYAGFPTIGKTDTGLLFQDGANAVHPWNIGTNAASDGLVDLGTSNNRFKDLYLSGGMYVGGTGSANLLDDYEEGEFVATLTPSGSGTVTLNPSYNSLAYTKIGRAVSINGRLNIQSISSPTGNIILNMPFVNHTGTDHSDWGGLSAYHHDINLGTGGVGVSIELPESTSNGIFLILYNNAAWSSLASQLDGSGSEWLYVSGTYFTT